MDEACREAKATRKDEACREVLELVTKRWVRYRLWMSLMGVLGYF